MSAVPQSLLPSAPRPLTVREYLDLERTAEFKSEYLDGVVYAMAGASRQHNIAKENLIGELHARFKGGPCQSYSSDQRVKVGPGNLFVYPDIAVVCGQVETAPEDDETIVNPQVVVEVQSPSTSRIDVQVKLRKYCRLDSVREVVLVSQEEPSVVVVSRLSDGDGRLSIVDGLDAILTLPSLGVSIPLADIYRNVAFAPPPGETPPG